VGGASVSSSFTSLSLLLSLSSSTLPFFFFFLRFFLAAAAVEEVEDDNTDAPNPELFNAVLVFDPAAAGPGGTKEHDASTR